MRSIVLLPGALVEEHDGTVSDQTFVLNLDTALDVFQVLNEMSRVCVGYCVFLQIRVLELLQVAYFLEVSLQHDGQLILLVLELDLALLLVNCIEVTVKDLRVDCLREVEGVQFEFSMLEIGAPFGVLHEIQASLIELPILDESETEEETFWLQGQI